MIAVGKRKKAIARAVIRKGSGKVFINGRPLQTMYTELIRLRILEPLMISGKQKEVDIHVNVKGGGIWGQADAIRTAIGRALVQFFGDEEMKRKFIDYDRTMVVSDARRTEPHKPSRSSAGPRRKKQQSKR